MRHRSYASYSECIWDEISYWLDSTLLLLAAPSESVDWLYTGGLSFASQADPDCRYAMSATSQPVGSSRIKAQDSSLSEIWICHAIYRPQ